MQKDILGLFEIDSLKAFISFELVEIINKSILSKKISTYVDTGEICSEDFKAKSYLVQKNGIKTRFAIVEMNLPKCKKKYLTILLNSKILREKYFEGITLDNIKTVYDALMKMNVVKFSFDTFLNSICSDVDFKRDAIDKNLSSGFSGITSLLEKTSLMHINNEVVKRYDEKTNKGIEFSKRECTSISKRPFWKIYHKELELKNNKDTKEFFASCLFNVIPDEEIEHRTRVEFTIKNKNHFKLFGIKNTSLGNLLKLSQEEKENMLKTIVNNYLGVKRIRSKSDRADVTPIEKMAINMINSHLVMEISFNRFIEILTEGLGRVNKSKHTARYKEIYDKHIKGSFYDKQAEETSKSIRMLIPWL